MIYSFNLCKENTDSDSPWVAESAELRDCVGRGNSAGEAIVE